MTRRAGLVSGGTKALVRGVVLAIFGGVLLAIVVARLPVLSAHTEVPADFRTLVAGADAIVRGHVTDVRGTTTAGGDIVSIVTIAVDEALEGDPGAFVSLVMPGGDVGRVRAVMPGVPRLHVRDAAVFLLRRGADHAWRLASLTAGLYPLRREVGTGRIVVDPPPLAGRTASPGRIERGDTRRRPMSVSEFDAFVRLVRTPRVQPIRRGRR